MNDIVIEEDGWPKTKPAKKKGKKKKEYRNL